MQKRLTQACSSNCVLQIIFSLLHSPPKLWKFSHIRRAVWTAAGSVHALPAKYRRRTSNASICLTPMQHRVGRWIKRCQETTTKTQKGMCESPWGWNFGQSQSEVCLLGLVQGPLWGSAMLFQFCGTATCLSNYYFFSRPLFTGTQIFQVFGVHVLYFELLLARLQRTVKRNSVSDDLDLEATTQIFWLLSVFVVSELSLLFSDTQKTVEFAITGSAAWKKDSAGLKTNGHVPSLRSYLFRSTIESCFVCACVCSPKPCFPGETHNSRFTFPESLSGSG